MSIEKTFAAIAQCKSLNKAADQLQLSKSTVSNHLAALEAELGTRLVQRHSRGIVLTEMGELFYARVMQALKATDEAKQLVRFMSTRLSGEISICLPPGMIENWLAPPIARFMEIYPDIKLVMTQHERTLDALAEGTDIALHWGELPDSSLLAQRIMQDELIMIAGRQYAERHREDLYIGSANIEVVRLPLNYAGETQKKVANLIEGWWFYQLPSRMTVNCINGIIALVRENAGVAAVPKSYVRRQLACGELVDVSRQMQTSGVFIQCYAVTVDRPKVGSRIHQFTGFIREYFESQAGVSGRM